MTLFEKYDRNLPEYYGAMYLDGYTPEQILHAARKELIQTHKERQEEKRIDASVEK